MALSVDGLAGAVPQVPEAVDLQDGRVLGQVDVEVDRAVESHEEVRDVGCDLDPVRPLHLFAVIHLNKNKEQKEAVPSRMIVYDAQIKEATK